MRLKPVREISEMIPAALNKDVVEPGSNPEHELHYIGAQMAIKFLPRIAAHLLFITK
jgi:hypothetical protein